MFVFVVAVVELFINRPKTVEFYIANKMVHSKKRRKTEEGKVIAAHFITVSFFSINFCL
jgi:hypothetical protein